MIQLLDRAAAPSVSQAKAMSDATNRAAWNVYIGGPYNGGAGWTPALVHQYKSSGVPGFLACYVGQQTGGNFTRGATDGSDAVALARAFGFVAGDPVALDVESGTYYANRRGVLRYIRDWTAIVKAAGHKAGVYGSPYMINDMLKRGLHPLPDFPWVASWVRHAEDLRLTPEQAPVDGYTGPARRVWQYAGGPAYELGLAVDISCADIQMSSLGGHPVDTIGSLPPAPKPSPAPAQSGLSWYVVKSGDTLSGVAAALGIDLATFEAINHDIAPNPNRIFPGEHLRIPAHGSPHPAFPAPAPIASKQYVVRRGDTLSGIAASSQTTLGAILAIPGNAHFRANPNLIYPGQIVYLP